jgi:hypothetical protein
LIHLPAGIWPSDSEVVLVIEELADSLLLASWNSNWGDEGTVVATEHIFSSIIRLSLQGSTATALAASYEIDFPALFPSNGVSHARNL